MILTISEIQKFCLDTSGKSVLLNMTSWEKGSGMKKALSGNKSSQHGFAEILAQAPQLAAAFGKWPGFMLMLITILALFTVSLVTAIALGKTVLGLFG